MRAAKRLSVWDTESILPAILIDGAVDATIFRNAMAALMREVSIGRGGRLAIFGEVVAELCAIGKPEEAIRLEMLWNQLAEHYRFDLQCAYPIDLFKDVSDGESLRTVCEVHQSITPTEQYTELTTESERIRLVTLLQQKERALEAELSKRTRILAAEEQARSTAQDALRQRDEFLGVASHELKTPVSTLSASAQLLLRKREMIVERPELADRYLDIIEQSARRLSRLVETLLEATQPITTQTDSPATPVDVADLLDKAVASISAAYSEWPEVRWGERLKHAVVNGDDNRLMLACMLVLDNAYTYSNEMLPIAVTMSDRGHGYVMSIADRGIGIPSGSEEIVFEAFGRGPNARNHHVGGLGLGLYVCRRIIDEHGGRIWLRRRGGRRGTTVNIWLPKSPESEAA